MECLVDIHYPIGEICIKNVFIANKSFPLKTASCYMMSAQLLYSIESQKLIILTHQICADVGGCLNDLGIDQL